MVWLMAGIGMVLIEGKGDWSTPKMLIGTDLMHKGDVASMAGDVNMAKYNYERAKVVVAFSPRLNYNLASFYLRINPENITPAIQCYKDANSLHSLPQAVLNRGNLYLVANQPENAINVWNAEIKKLPNAQIANNLGMLYWNLKKTDAAIGAMKKALSADPNLSAAYSNLANIYWENNDKKFAREFAKASLNVSNPSNMAISNAIWFSFKDSTLTNMEIPALKASNVNDFTVQNNYALHLIKKQKNEEAKPWLNELAKMDSAELQCFIAYQWFLGDSVVKAKSKADYLSTISPKYQSRANYMLGVAALQKGLPEMAKIYFRRMGEAGDSTGLYYEGLALARAGMPDSAAFKFNLARATHPEMGEKIGKEMALLQKSCGQEHLAELEYDLNKLKSTDYIRAGIYADSSNNFIYAMQAFREAIAKDSSTVAPYLELGKILNKYRNIQAIENLNYGLKRFPDNLALKTALVKAFLYQKNLKDAEKLLAEIKKQSPEDFSVRLVDAELAASKSDTVISFPIFRKLNKENPCNQEVILAFAAQLLKANKNNEGYELMYNALQINSENAGIWYYLAHFTHKWGLPKDAGFDALKAISLTRSQSEKIQIQKEFDRDIKEALGTLGEEEEKKPELIEIK
jgi:tetratricopeptide (TPR) repeat protein